MKVDFVIKTFERKDALEKLLLSIEKYYPNQHIIIADDSSYFDKEFYKKFNLNLDVYYLGFDVGLSYGRNYCFKVSKADWIMLLDDDFVFTGKTNLETLVKATKLPNVGVIGGSLDNHGAIDGYNLKMEIINKTLLYHFNENDFQDFKGIKYQESDIVYNFGLFKREAWLENKWDEKIKIKGEHSDFFLRLKKTKWRAYYVPEVVVIHEQNRKGDYGKFRQRNDGMIYFFKKYKIDKIISVNGQTARVDENKNLSLSRA
jgi:GT2 family glycosyltransferase